MKIWLDDDADKPERSPPDTSWAIAKTYHEAVILVELHGWPKVVSFDHDLGEEKTGYDFAKFLVERDLDGNTMPLDFSFKVHSANIVGKRNIEGLLNSYLEFKRIRSSLP